VICLGDDPREYGIIHPLSAYAGRDVVIVTPRTSLRTVRRMFGRNFVSIDQLPALQMLHSGKFSMLIAVFMGRGFKPAV